MKLKNTLIVVNDIEKSIDFYTQLFGLKVILHTEGTVILTEGLVLQEMNSWEQAINKECIPNHNMSLLYFEETNIEEFQKKLEKYLERVEYVTPLTTYPWGKKVIRFYDFDGNLIEVGTPV